MNDWDTGWDPYQALQICENNIEQLALALNASSEAMKEISQYTQKHNEAIAQLMRQQQIMDLKIATIFKEFEQLREEINRKQV